MSNAPHFDIDVPSFWADPYPALAKMRKEAPIAFVPQLGSTVFTRRDDIFTQEKRIDVFSSHQPNGLMNVLMGHNMMRKDGDAHMTERQAMFPAVSPRTVRDTWVRQFQAHADRILDELAPKGSADLCKALALPLSAECLKDVTGLTNMRYQDMDAWSQAMIDGIANYTGNKEVEARCHAATSGIDAAIDDMIPVVKKHPNTSILSVLLAAGQNMESIRANIKLAISGGQNEPRDAIAGAIWALLTHPEQLALVRDGKAKWIDVFEEYARWIAPIQMSPRRVAKPWTYGGIDFEPEDRVFFMFGSANRDEACFAEPDRFDITRNTQKSIAFGAGPHYCAGAFASRAMVADVALPSAFARLKGLRLDEQRTGADRRLGVSRIAQSAGEVGCRLIVASGCLLARTFPVAERVDDRAARNGVKRQRLHVVIVDEILAQFGVIGVQHPLRGARMDIALAVVAGVEQQRGAALDADIAQAQEQRAERLAVTLDAKQFAAGVGALDLRLEILVPAAPGRIFRMWRQRTWRRSGRIQERRELAWPTCPVHHV